MKLEELGYNPQIKQLVSEHNLSGFEIGRVIAEHKERYIVKTENGEFESEITGNLRFSAKGREDFPTVGDWVAITVFDSGNSIIHKIIPRQSMISRQAIDKFGEIQVIAANIDYALLVQAADRDFNINRLERYLTICNSSKVKPVIVLTKTDLIDKDYGVRTIELIKKRIKGVDVFAISNTTLDGYEDLSRLIEKGKTFCLLGSSGVGKSTLVNNLYGKQLMSTKSISLSTGKGKHTTSHREMIFLENGGILIDNPGMREVGVVDKESGMEMTFDLIFTLSQKCKFKNCTHTNEIGCAVIEAIENGSLERDVYENYIKIQKEISFFETSVSEKKKRDKILGKIIKDYHRKGIK